MSSDPREVVRTRLLDWAFKPGEGVDQRGRPLAWSLDCRELTLHGPTLSTIAELLWWRVAAYRPDLIAGPSLSADPIVAALLLAAARHGVELSGGLLRREPKGYGLDKVLEGPPVVPGVVAVVVDDVLTRGSSTARTVHALRELGAVPRAVVTIVDLERDDRERLEGIEYETLFTASELGLTLFREPPPATGGWTVRGVNSPIPTTPPVRPVVAGDEAILVGDRGGVLAVDRRGGVRAVDASGTVCAAAVDNLLVLGSAAAVSAFDPVSLRRHWSIDIGARALCCSAAGNVFVAREDPNEVVRIDAGTGTVTASSRPLLSCIDALQIIGDGLVLVTRFEVAALDRSLNTRWVRTEPVRLAAASSDGLFVLARGPTLTRLNLRDGSVAWSRRIGPRTLPQLVATDDCVVFAVESVLVGLTGAGAVRWVHSAPRRIVAGPVACASGALAVADSVGIVRVLSIADGDHVASYSALPVQPIELAGAPSTLVGIGADGNAWGIDLAAQA